MKRICQKGKKCPFRVINGGTLIPTNKPYCTGCDNMGVNVGVKAGTDGAALILKHGGRIFPSVEAMEKA